MGSVRTFIRTTSPLRSGLARTGGRKDESSHHRSGVAPHGANVILERTLKEKTIEAVERGEAERDRESVVGHAEAWTTLTNSIQTDEVAKNADLLGAADNHDLIGRPEEFEKANSHRETADFWLGFAA